MRVHTDGVDKANNALASVYTHAARVTVDSTDPGIEFPTAGPRAGSVSTITPTDATSKVKRPSRGGDMLRHEDAHAP